MLLKRWQASEIPTPEQMKMMLFKEGLDFKEEVYAPKKLLYKHQHPYDEVRVILTGSMIFNLSGNKVLLRAGDRIEIPSNTKHEMEVHGEEECRSIVAFKVF